VKFLVEAFKVVDKNWILGVKNNIANQMQHLLQAFGRIANFVVLEKFKASVKNLELLLVNVSIVESTLFKQP